MHILIIPSWYPNKKHPLNGIYFNEQAKSLAETGIKISVIYPNYISFNPYDFFKYKDNRLGLVKKQEGNIFSIGFPKFQYKKAYLFDHYLEKAYKEVLKVNGSVDLIHSHSCIWAGFYGVKLAKKLQIPSIVTEHGSMYRYPSIINKYWKYIDFITSEVDKFVTVGKGLYEIFSKFIDINKMEIIPNMVDFDQFKINNKNKIKINPDLKKLLNKNAPFIFFSLGALRKIKGFDILIEAFKKAFYKNSNGNVLLLIGGDGEEKGNLKKMIKEIGLDDKVILLGQLNRDEVSYYMNLSDAFVLTSRYETFGISYIEALAHGKPIIATKCGGPESIVNNFNGYLCEVDDLEGISFALKSMVKNISKFDSDLIRKDCKDKFGKETFTKKYIKLYSLLVDSYKRVNK